MGIFDKIWDVTTDFLHGVTGLPTADEKRNQARMVSDQMAAYKKQTEIAQQEVAEKRNQEVAEKRRINEKQVNALRSRFSHSGFLGSDTGNTDGFPDTLGA